MIFLIQLMFTSASAPYFVEPQLNRLPLLIRKPRDWPADT